MTAISLRRVLPGVQRVGGDLRDLGRFFFDLNSLVINGLLELGLKLLDGLEDQRVTLIKS